MATTQDLRWDKPGPGSWQLDSSHCGPAPGPIQRNIYSTAMPAGFAEGFDLFGAPLKTIQNGWVNGKMYIRLVPLIGGGVDVPPPPSFVLWLVSRLHPTFRAAERKARESLASHRWREEIRRWDEEWKPALAARNAELGSVDLAALTDDDLAEHLEEVHAHVLDGAALHFRLHVSDMGPLGNLMVHLEDWGLHRDDTFRALGKASPATRAPAEELRRIAGLLTKEGVDPASVTSLEQVRATSPEASGALDAYLATHGWRLTTGYEVEDRCLIELPELVVRSIQGAASMAERPDPGAEADALLAGLRDDIPPEHLEEFDELVADARLSYGLRDENGPLTYEWPAGLLRRALVTCGERLETDGRLAQREQVFELTVDEIAGLLRGAAEPDQAEVDSRAEERRRWASVAGPATLGRDEGDPPVDVLPANLAAFTRIVLAVTSSLEAEQGGPPLTGMGIGTEPYTGVARVVTDASEALSRVEPGDVIVTPYTAPTYNAVLAVAGALVTQEGGLLCHAAVIARELDLPAVIGAGEAMSAIPDGATVEVDPVAGKVRVVDAVRAPAG